MGRVLRMVLIIAGTIGFAVLVLAVLVVWVFWTGLSSTRDAWRAAAEQQTGHAKSMARLAFAKTSKYPIRLTGPLSDGGSQMEAHELGAGQGRFTLRDKVGAEGNGRGRLWCDSTNKHLDHPDNLVLTFDYEGGNGSFVWNSKESGN
ncbi:MAG: hypothetical protein HS108_10020 [Planctomycetes bacterium]|jgi:hypothetical protein|nr:hypothetical protein [Planctomycetota bacterium]MCL4729510.1 hypothetical protein [Planctomycetota bacterium]